MAPGATHELKILRFLLNITNIIINKDWLKTGNGNMFNEEEKPGIRLEHLIEIYKKLNKPLQDYLVDQTELLFKAYSENIMTK